MRSAAQLLGSLQILLEGQQHQAGKHSYLHQRESRGADHSSLGDVLMPMNAAVTSSEMLGWGPTRAAQPVVPLRAQPDVMCAPAILATPSCMMVQTVVAPMSACRVGNVEWILPRLCASMRCKAKSVATGTPSELPVLLSHKLVLA